MVERCILLNDCEKVSDSVYTIDLNGKYYIPSFLLVLSEFDPRLDVVWREKAPGSFTKMVYDACTFNNLNPDNWESYFEPEERDSLEFIPKFSLYDSKNNEVTHYCSAYSLEYDCNVAFTLHNGDVVDVDFSKAISTADELYNIGFRFDGNDIDFRYFIAANVKLCQRKVLSIKLIQ